MIELAPARPNCYSTTDMWHESLASAAEEQRIGKPGPLDLRKQPASFNYSWNFCRDCMAKYALSMQSLGLCNPRHLKDLAKASNTKEPA